MNHTLSASSLSKSYKQRQVVSGVDLELHSGEVVGLLGPNGAGKTTTFYMITGMIKPDAGKVFLDQEEITKIPMYKRARMGIGYLPQEASIEWEAVLRQCERAYRHECSACLDGT